MRAVVAVLAAALVSACGGERVVMDSADGATRLAYRCDRVTPRARTPEEVAVVRRYGFRAVRKAAEEGRLFSVSEIQEAYERSDAARLETSIVRYLCANPAALAPERVAFPDSGAVAPDFTLPLLASSDAEPPRTVRLAELRGKVVLIDFWATWCKACRQTHPMVAALAREYRDTDLVVLGIALNDAPEQVREQFAAEGGPGHPFAIDEQASLQDAYLLRGIPRMFLIDREGRLASQCIGCSVDGKLPPQLLARLRSLLAEKKASHQGPEATGKAPL